MYWHCAHNDYEISNIHTNKQSKFSWLIEDKTLNISKGGKLSWLIKKLGESRNAF